VWIRLRVKEPDAWRKTTQATSTAAAAKGSLVPLLTHPLWRKRAILGLLLAATGLGTFWGVTVAGQDLTRRLLVERGTPAEDAQQQAIFAYSLVQTTGGGLGLLAFGPLAARWGRRPSFLFFQIAAVIIVPLTCYLPATYVQLLCMLPVYGFFTLGLHAGFAVYFPELFPTSLRATGTGFCFNGGRFVAAPILLFSGWLKSQSEMDLRLAVTLLSLLFIPGMLMVTLLPETKDQPLPE
jgi:MFS family permease